MPKEQPTKTTLRTVADQAEYNYQQYLRAVEQNKRFYHAPLGAAALAGVEALTEKGNPGGRPGENHVDYKVRVTQGRVRGNLERAAEHFRQHQGEYHDLAVIDAHLDGVKINVEQPLEIGQKIEVRAPEHK